MSGTESFLSETPKYEVKPQFRPLQTLIVSCIVGLIATLFLGHFVVMLVMAGFALLIFLMAKDMSDVEVIDKVFSGYDSVEELELSFVKLSIALPALLYFLIFVIAVWIIYRSSKKNTENTVYRFFDDRIEYYEGYMRKNFRVLYYRDVTGVWYTQGVAQARRGIASIHVQALNGNSTLVIHDVETAEEVVRMVQSAKVSPS